MKQPMSYPEPLRGLLPPKASRVIKAGKTFWNSLGRDTQKYHPDAGYML